MSSAFPFPYPPLPSSIDAIRILTLTPGAFTDPLQCTLTVAPFIAKPLYAALSYTWDLPHPDLSTLTQTISRNNTQDTEAPDSAFTTILVNTHPLQIHPNLALALHHLRSKTTPLPLWIDALCINQSSLPERNAQVAMMSFIYARAQKVIAWLGLREINPTVTDPMTILARECGDGVAGDIANAVAEGGKVRTSKEPGRSSFDFARIATSGYWTRLWIVQEVCLARELVFVFGGKVWREEEVQGWELLRHAKGLKEQVGREATGNEGLEARGMLRVLEARAGRHGDEMRFEKLVERFMGQGCGELRDKIFGLLGLAVDIRAAAEGENCFEEKFESLEDAERWLRSQPGRGTGTLRVDYSRPYYDIWTDAVKAVFFRARPISSRFPNLDASYERSVSIVRTAGVLQAALAGRVEEELPHPQTAHVEEKPIFQVLGYIAGKITNIGPDYNSLVGSFRAQQIWASICEQQYKDVDDLERIRLTNERYSIKIISYNDKELNRISKIRSKAVMAWPSRKTSFSPECTDFDQKYNGLWEGDVLNRECNPADERHKPRVCIGTHHLMALVPPATNIGDVIVRFWGCDAAFVMRLVHVEGLHEDSQNRVPYFMLVGRADVADKSTRDDHPDVDVDATKNSGMLVWISLGTRTLQLLTAGIALHDS